MTPAPPPCARCASPLEAGDLRCAICALPAPAPAPAAPAAAPPARPRARVLRCTECGAAIGFSARAGAPHCAFCGAAMAVEQPADPLEVAQVRLPFTVDRAAAEAALRGWLGRRGWFAPRTLRDEAVLESLTPLWWAAWIVTADAAVAWTADSDAGAGRAAWAPHSGQVAMRFAQICVPATRGLDPEECRRLVPAYDLATAEPAGAPPPPGAAGAALESFDAQRSAARAAVQRAIEAAARTRAQAHVPGRRSRNVRVACLIEAQTTERVALPAWVLAYRFRGAPYRAIVHGQRGGLVLGRAPLDRAKVAAVALASAAAAALAALALHLLP